MVVYFFAAETGHVEVDKAVFQHLSQNFGSQRGKVFFTACVIREANDLEKIMLVSYVFTRKIIECIFSCVFMCMLCNFSVIFAYLCNFLRLWSKRNQRRNMTQDYPQLSFTMFYIWLGSDTLENIVIYYNYGTGQGATCHFIEMVPARRGHCFWSRSRFSETFWRSHCFAYKLNQTYNLAPDRVLRVLL